MTGWIWPSDTPPPPGASGPALVGGKAMGLHRLHGAGLRVPEWLTITTAAYEAAVTHARLAELENSAPDTTPETTHREAARRLTDEPLPADLRATLDDAWERMRGMAPLAVRSSGAAEDSESHSFAGQNDTFLNVTSRAELERAVRGCWASVFGERAVAYRRQLGLHAGRAAMAVVVQQMIDPDVSGVLFTLDPVSGRRDRMVVSGVWGLGEGLVSGKLDADTFELATDGTVVKSVLAEKRHAFVRGAGGGVREAPVPAERASAPTLGAPELADLARIGRQVAELLSAPADIEFCVAGGEIHLLQARPVTALVPETGSAARAPAGCAGGVETAGHHRIWDNSNIVESYSGITLPLTFSFIRMAYRGVYVQFAELLGCSKEVLRAEEPLFWNMLGLIEGRVYYNLLNWYRLIGLMPAFRANRRFMEQMMGVRTPVGDDVTVAPPGGGSGGSGGSGRGTLALLQTALRMAWLHLTLDRRIREFQRDFRQTHAEFAGRDYRTLPPAAVLAAFHEFVARVLWRWKAPIVNDFEAMITYGLLAKLTVAWEVDAEGSLHNDLLCAEGGITSTAVMTELRTIAADLALLPGQREAFAALGPEAALVRLRTDPDCAGIARELDRYLATYGVRCVQEMKLESVPMSEDPVFCMGMIRNYLASPEVPGREAAAAGERRQLAEQAVQERFTRQGPVRGRLRSLAYFWLVRNARAAVRNRENQRFARTEAYAVVRSMFRAIGEAWAARGLLAAPRDVFYLEVGEIESYVEGTATCTDLEGLVALRKREYGAYEERIPDDRIETFGEVYGGNLFRAPAEAATGGQTLRGLGACRGVVEGRARIVLQPDAELRLAGEVLVARETDPGWTVLFPSISGLVVEKGSMLSHSAIVAREMGIPAVVGVKGATTLIRDGERIRVDGARGTVELLEREADDGSGSAPLAPRAARLRGDGP